ncbi:MAG: hypothetical protein U0704_02530 [Candidatus Eisenbacteria bacterium]
MNCRAPILGLALASSFLATPAFASATPDSVAGVSISCPDPRTGAMLELRAQRLDSLGVIVPEWAAGSGRTCIGAMQDVTTSFASDDAGGAFVVWTDTRTGDADLWIQHLTAAGEPATGWAESGRALSTAPGAQLAASLCPDGAGGVVVAWQDYRSGATADIRAQRISGSGSELWDLAGVAVCDEPHDQTSPSVAPDGANGAFVFWQDARNGDSDIRALHVDGTGVADAEQCVACGEGARRNPSVTADGIGGAWLVWEAVNGAGVDVRAVRLGSDLARRAGFSTEGVVVAGGSGIQFLPVATPGAGEDLIVAWCDRSLDAGDVRAQRLTPGGAIAWPDSGVLVSTAAGEQYAPAIATDGRGGAIVAWEQSHGGSPDIRAARVNSAGELPWGPLGQPVCVGPGDQFAPAVTGDGGGGAFFTWTDAAAPARGTILPGRAVSTQGLPVFVSLTVTPRKAHLRWRAVSVEPRPITIERRVPPADWSAMAELRANVDSLLEYEDTGLTAGAVIEYRLAVQTPDGPLYLPVQTAHIPAPPAFTLRFARYVASGDALQLRFTLPVDSPVSVEVMDVAGRRVKRIPLAATEAGEHDERVPGLALASGWYFVRLHQGRDVRGSRLVVVR